MLAPPVASPVTGALSSWDQPVWNAQFLEAGLHLHQPAQVTTYSPGKQTWGYLSTLMTQGSFVWQAHITLLV